MGSNTSDISVSGGEDGNVVDDNRYQLPSYYNKAEPFLRPTSPLSLPGARRQVIKPLPKGLPTYYAKVEYEPLPVVKIPNRVFHASPKGQSSNDAKDALLSVSNKRETLPELMPIGPRRSKRLALQKKAEQENTIKLLKKHRKITFQWEAPERPIIVNDRYPTRDPRTFLDLERQCSETVGELKQWPGIQFEWIPNSFIAYNASLERVYYAGFHLINRLSFPYRRYPNDYWDEELLKGLCKFEMGDFIRIRNQYFQAEAQIISCYQASNRRIFWYNKGKGNRENVQQRGKCHHDEVVLLLLLWLSTFTCT